MIIKLSPDASLASIPRDIVPYEWLEKGFACMPHVVKSDGSVSRLKGFIPQSTADSYRAQLVSCIQTRSYPVNICSQRIQVVCKGLVGVDIDIKDNKDGLRNFAELLEHYKFTPSALIIQTKSLGYHHYYRLSSEQDDVKSPAPFKSPSGKVWEGIDIRGGNSFLIAPMSMTVRSKRKAPSEPDSIEYRVIKCNIETVADLPPVSDSFVSDVGTVRELAKELEDSVQLNHTNQSSATLSDLIRSCSAEVAGAESGGRNTALYGFCCKIIGMGYMEPEVVALGMTFAERCKPPLPDFEANSTIYSAWNAHSEKRKEAMLRGIRERYVVMPKGQGIAVIDLYGMPGNNVISETAFRKLKGNSLKLPVNEVYTEEERELLGKRLGKFEDMFQFMLNSETIRRVEMIGYRPGADIYCPIDVFDDAMHGREMRFMVNNYLAPKLIIDPRATLDDSAEFIKDWLRIAHHICGEDPYNTDLFLNWLAYCIQNPTKRPLFAPMFINYPGSGKSTTLRLLWHLFGRSNCAVTKVPDVVLSSGFNSQLANKRLIWIDEMPASLSPIEQSRLESEINSLVTESFINITAKGSDTALMENHALLVMTSNHDTCYKFKPDERRIMVFRNMDKSTQIDRSIYARVAEVLSNEADSDPVCNRRRSEYVGHLFNYLSKRDITGFDAQNDAPMTRAKSMLTLGATTSNVDRLKIDIANNRGVFVSDVVSLDAVIYHYAIFHPIAKTIKLGEIKAMTTDSLSDDRDKLLCIICDESGEARNIPHYPLSFSTMDNIIRIDSEIMQAPPKLYTVRNHAKWRSASNEEVLLEYLKLDKVGKRIDSLYLVDDQVTKIKNELRSAVLH